ncbi:hypothetical protein [Dyadobacter sp. CY351]|uniref:hypothetical protein n=1 Tax=Dyadobacter sp. CY351 TaxID=2909337 RepID=UPI001F2BF467|nr:hypothetical protein [Dyadobacter sp. CY351]MCF2517149.1 hypothetical protein [Dyadobacter sp. CY351]
MNTNSLISLALMDSAYQNIEHNSEHSNSAYFLLNAWKCEESGNKELDASLQHIIENIIEEFLIGAKAKAQMENLALQTRFVFDCLIDAVNGNYRRFEEAMDQDLDVQIIGEEAAQQYLFSIICDKGSVTDLPNDIEQYAELVAILKQKDIYDCLSRYNEFMLTLRANILLKRPFKDSLALIAEL